ncbi:peroxidase-like [Papilio machaon]|uniref:peroxidase-like n=1 Tax=Papilio machaon TaxID=76193 RepID=UPI001E6635B4|nr:peroxidase-like [Papilio machaon]
MHFFDTMYLLLVQFALLFVCVNSTFLVYDSYTGTPITQEELKRHDKRNTTFWCTSQFFSCNPHEGRRPDGSCNNLRYPTRGMSHTPPVRLLPPVFDKNYNPRLSKSGGNLPLARFLRKRLLMEGQVPDQKFTQLTAHFMLLLNGDILSFHDTVKYILWKPHCCSEKGKTDYACVPNKIPDNDPVHRFSDIRCLNMTRPESFQSVGCVNNDTNPERILSSTPAFDVSILYGNTMQKLLTKGRKFEGGLLKYEVENGKIWPPSVKGPVNLCLLNQKPYETRCHDTPEEGVNSVAGVNLSLIWFWRLHNHIATALGRINPCWDDDRLFYTARDIVIALQMQIFLYELLPAFVGKENLIKAGVISSHSGHRDSYNESLVPQISIEYMTVLRWFHTIQSGTVKMYDSQGFYLKQIPIANLTLRTGFYAIDNNIDYITQGAFRQASGKFDHAIDPELGESVLGPHQKASDTLTNDLAKNRYFGLQPYVKYLELCRRRAFKKFEDLLHVMDPERVEMLQEAYEHLEDVDFQAGLWLENFIEGGHVPVTFYCIVVEQMLRSMASDRHWYERPNRPNAFTLPQLKEIRKISIARVLCDVGDSVTRIQRHAFLRISPTNPLCGCNEIEGIDFWAWEDNTCSNDGSYHGPDYKVKTQQI